MTIKPTETRKPDTHSQDAGKAGEYAAISRKGKTGDRKEIKLEMPVRIDCMPDNPKRIAFFKGPLLLSGDQGPDKPLELVTHGVLGIQGQRSDGWEIVQADIDQMPPSIA